MTRWGIVWLVVVALAIGVVALVRADTCRLAVATATPTRGSQK